MDDPIEFIKLLKSQHRSIISTISDIDSQEKGSSDLKSSVEKLKQITDLLFDHLEKEDKMLYPSLINHKETQEIGKKYYYDMERLSCIAIDFFKRYCVNREGLKIFVEDFVNSYSLFKELLKVRIKREEVELYPAFILSTSGVMHSEVVNYIQEQEAKSKDPQKKVFVYGQNQTNLEALSLALEMSGYQVGSTRHVDQVSSMVKSLQSDLVLFDLTKLDKNAIELIMHLKEQIPNRAQVVGYTTNELAAPTDKLQNTLDDYIPKAAFDMEKFSERVKAILTK